MSSCTPMWMWVYSREHPFWPYPVWCNWTLQWMDGATDRRCLAVFPRHKGRTTLISILSFGPFLVAFIIKSIVSTDNVYSWARRLTATVKVKLKISLVERLRRSGLFLVPSTFPVELTTSHLKRFEFPRWNCLPSYRVTNFVRRWQHVDLLKTISPCIFWCLH
jgi:hypothetical protein